MKELGTFDLETMEFKGNILIPGIEEKQRGIRYYDKKTSTDELNLFMAEKYGSFYFIFHKILKKDIRKQYIIRFLYLCTYMTYDGFLLYGNAHVKKKDTSKRKALNMEIDMTSRYMTEKDLQEVLNLSEREIIRTRKMFIEKELIFTDQKGNLRINDNCCFKGISPNVKTGKTRVFENALRNLYEKAKPTEHKKLALLIELLPYVNLQHNVICHNPLCEFKNQLDIINFKELCELVGYSESNVSLLKKDLLALKVGEESVVMFVITEKSKSITINPRIYYGGNDLGYLAPVSGYFDIKG